MVYWSSPCSRLCHLARPSRKARTMPPVWTRLVWDQQYQCHSPVFWKRAVSVMIGTRDGSCASARVSGPVMFRHTPFWLSQNTFAPDVRSPANTQELQPYSQRFGAWIVVNSSLLGQLNIW